MSGGIVDFLRRIFVYGDNPLVRSYAENRIRPPGAVEEERFISLCIRCNRCLEVCPYSSIRRAGIGVTLGTPYVFPESRACYLCMACCRLCPTDALDSRLVEPERVRMGKARIDASICYSILFLEQDTVQDASAVKIPALCNTCYNVCPFPDKAILLKGNLYPVVTDACVGCGICVERCPTRPRRAINIVPAGMGRTDEAGFHYQRGRKFRDQADVPRPPQEGRVWSGQDLLDQKKRIPPTDDKVQPRFPSTTDKFQRDLE